MACVELFGPSPRYLLVSVVKEPDPTLVTGTGFAGGVMSPEEFAATGDAAVQETLGVLEDVAAALEVSGLESRVLRGDAATAICRFAEEQGADAIVVGTRGRSGLKRAVLGSVSDHVVRHAPCAVVVAGER